MRLLWSSLRKGLETRVANRTFLLFALCAAAPVAIFSLIGYRMVKAELGEHASQTLRSASKSYGLLIFSRLEQADALLTSLARQHLERNLPPDALPGSVLGHVRIVRVDADSSAPAVHNGGSPVRTLKVQRTSPHPTLQLSISVAQGVRRLTLVGEIDPTFLWGDDAVGPPSAGMCVFDHTGRPLHCTGPDAKVYSRPSAAWPQGTASRADDVLTSEWSLYLRQRYAAEDWTIRAYQPASIGYSTSSAFGTLLSAVAALAVVGALLLSAIQLRRSHRPLIALIKAAQRIGRMRFSRKVRIDSHDEYARLGHAFNVMGTRLKEQFSLLSTLARIDRRILAHDSGTSVVNALLPKLPRMMGCRAAAILLLEERESARLSVVRRATRRPSIAGPEISRQDLAALLSGRRAAKLDAADAGSLAAQLLKIMGMPQALIAAITVDGELRGALLLGYSAPRPEKHARRNVIGVAQRIAVAIRNEERERALLKQAYYDSLTGLPNRTLFRDRLHQELTRAQDRGTGGALMFIDIDRFKHVNDSLGHTVGDELLASLAQRISTCCRPGDTLARLGGDEFAIIAPDIGAAECLKLIESLFDTLRIPLQLQDIRYVAEASIGIAMYPQDGAGTEALLRNADLAMYRAKASSRGQAQFFKEEMNREATWRLEVEHRLRSALLNDELTVHFQPIVRAQDGAIVGAEALVRWLPAEGNAIAPAQFIPIAEDTGLIIPLGGWILREACRCLRAWRDSGIDLGYIAVNVSTRQLTDPAFVASVIECLERHSLGGESIEIEVTESILARNTEAIGETLQQLRRRGMRVAMDDFGTGYSSMAILGKLPIDVLKIDQSFVQDCTRTAQAQALAQALISVGRALDKVVVVEGVESEVHRRALAQMGCDRMQGYLFARPMTQRSFAEHCRLHGTKAERMASCA